MKRLKIVLFGICMLLCQHGTFAQQQLLGKVLDASSQSPVPKAKIQVLQKGGKGNTALTDENGAYTLSVNEGAARLMIQRNGYQTQMPKIADLEDGNFQLTPKTAVNKTLNASTAGAIVSVARKNQSVSVSGGGLGASFLHFVFDHEEYEYYVANLSHPDWPVYSGDFEKMKDDRDLFGSDLYHHETDDGQHHYSVELKDKFVATNFPFHQAEGQRTGLFSGVNTKVNNNANFNQFDGIYMGLLLDMPTGEFEGEDGMIWGLAIFMRPEEESYGEQTGAILMNLYDTQSVTPDELDWEEEIELLVESIDGGDVYLNEDVEDILFGSYTVDPMADESFNVQFVSMEDVMDAESDSEIEESSEYFAASGFADNNSAMMTIDIPDQGMLQFVKIADLEGNNVDTDGPGGDYLYIQSDVDFGGGAGVFEITPETESMNIHFFPDQEGDEEDMETQEDVPVHQSSIQNLYYTDGYEEDDFGDFSERLFMLISNDFMMHFTIDTETGGLMNYGIGAIDK